MSSKDIRTARDLDRAESAMNRRIRGDGMRFMGIRQAAGWFYEARERAQSPPSWSPRMEEAKGGAMVCVQVDGGRGSDPHESRAVLSTIGTALHDLKHDYPQAAHFFQRSVRDGESIRSMSKHAGLSGSTISAQIGRAEAYLMGRLKGAGLLA